MVRIALGSVVAIALGLAQPPPLPPDPVRFEVASIRPSNSEQMPAGWSGCATTPGLVTCTNVTLKRAISGAYGIGLDRVLGGPAWAESDRFQITGKADRPADEGTLDKMLQALIAERFGLKFHRENRPGEALVMEVAKNGPKFQQAGDAPTSINNGHGVLEAPSITMRIFTEILSRDLNLPVVDRTGLKGAFKFTVRWNADRPRIAAPDDPAGDLKWEISSAIAQQLGLTLKSHRMPVEILVIDHAEKPLEN
jgi:uncharacterized protein (TIGR03435 family)